jgi:hypothetical protein
MIVNNKSYSHTAKSTEEGHSNTKNGWATTTTVGEVRRHCPRGDQGTDAKRKQTPEAKAQRAADRNDAVENPQGKGGHEHTPSD